MVGTWSRMSLRFENLAGMVWPKDPIGPDGGGSFDVPVAPGPGIRWSLAPVVVGAAAPADGCREMGSTRAACASSGVGMLVTSVDCDDGCGAAPVLIWPVFGTSPG